MGNRNTHSSWWLHNCMSSCKEQQRFCFLGQMYIQRGSPQSFGLLRGYLFFLASFCFLLVWEALLERAVEWPVVFRWSKSLFLVVNSYRQVTQRRLTSFYKEQTKKSYIKLSFLKLADMSFLRAKTDSEVELHDLGGNWIAKQNWLLFFYVILHNLANILWPYIWPYINIAIKY